MNKNTIFVGIVALIVGMLAVHTYHVNRYFKLKSAEMNQSMDGMHIMPDGTMMGNNGEHSSMNMDSMMDGMLANMKGKSGKELEKAFITDMIPHHQGAVDMAKLLLQDKTVQPELVKFANDIITAQEGEIRQMNEWLKNY